MGKPFQPPRGKTVEIPYRTAVIRADPDFEWGKRHEPFYEFSNGRRFDENTDKQGAYNFPIVNVKLTLQGNGGTAIAGIVTPQGPPGVFALLGGVEGDTGLGSLALSNVTPALLTGVAASGLVGTISVGAQSASPNLAGVKATGALGIINQGQLQQPILTLTSVAGVANPTFTFTLDPAIVAGDTMTFQEQVDGGDWSSPIVNVVHTFTSGEIAAGEVDLGRAGRSNGTYDARMLVTHSAVNSAWSDVVVFTVSVATAGTPLGLLLTITH